MPDQAPPLHGHGAACVPETANGGFLVSTDAVSEAKVLTGMLGVGGQGRAADARRI